MPAPVTVTRGRNASKGRKRGCQVELNNVSKVPAEVIVALNSRARGRKRTTVIEPPDIVIAGRKLTNVTQLNVPVRGRAGGRSRKRPL